MEFLTKRQIKHILEKGDNIRVTTNYVEKCLKKNGTMDLTASRLITVLRQYFLIEKSLKDTETPFAKMAQLRSSFALADLLIYLGAIDIDVEATQKDDELIEEKQDISA